MGNVRGMLVARISLGAAVATLAFTVAAAPALGAAAYTGGSEPGMTDATTYGYVTPQTENTVWTFAYGVTTKYGSYTKLGAIKAGQSPVLVAAQLPNLLAGTTYHYLLFALPYDSSGNPDWANASYGQDATFTTTRGALSLLSTRLAVKHGAASVPVLCASTLACSGSIKLSARGRVGRSFKTVGCGSARIRLAANARSTLQARLGSSCSRLVGSAHGRRLAATASATLSSGQDFSSQAITLIG